MEEPVALRDAYRPGDQRQRQADGSNNNIDSTPSLRLNEKKVSARRIARWEVLSKCLHLCGAFLFASLPRYMQPGGLRRTKKLTPSSYLDALRGYAACFVFNHHIGFERSTLWIVHQPFVRIMHSAEGNVDLFFVISGYALSYRLLMLMRNQQAGPMLDSFASSVFRRYLRLYASACVATFICMLLIRINWVAITWPNQVARTDTLFEQFWDWAKDFGNFSNPFVALEGYFHSWTFTSRYLFTLWTIPLEFRGSMVLFAFCMAVCKLSTKHRMVLCWATIALCYYWQTIYAALFLYGMIVADISLGRHPGRSLKPSTQLLQHEGDNTVAPRDPSVATRIGYTVMLVVALLFISAPTYEDPTAAPFPFQHLNKAIPAWGTALEAHFYPSIGAALLVFALESYPTLQKPLNLNFSQYLGDLSFGIYLMHPLLMWSLSPHVLEPFREKYLGGSIWAQTPGLIILYLAVLWAAEWFMRIDSRVVRLGRYLQKVMFVKWKE